MALFDSTLMLYHVGNSFNFTAGEFFNLATTTASSASSVINLGNARDLGIGPGAEVPKVVVVVGTAVTTGASASQQVNLQFQGSTDSVNWTTYMETGYAATASWAAGSAYRFDVPRRPPGAALPLYYRLDFLTQGLGTASATAISTGTLLSGIVLEWAESAGTLDQYQSGFSVS
jgi:hypothetical protein